MIEIKKNKHELIDSALKRLKQRMIMEDILEETYRRRQFETPRERKKRKLKLVHKKAKLK